MSKFNQTERRIELIKELQNEDRQNDDLCELFEINQNTLDEDKKALREGVEILGWKIKLNLMPRQRSYGNSPDLNDSRFHPIFLCLNTTELFVLLSALQGSTHPIVSDRLHRLIQQQISKSGKKGLEGFGLTLTDKDVVEPPIALQQSKLYSPSNIALFFLKPKLKVQVDLFNANRLVGHIKQSADSSLYYVKSENGNHSQPFAAADIRSITRIS